MRGDSLSWLPPFLALTPKYTVTEENEILSVLDCVSVFVRISNLPVELLKAFAANQEFSEHD